MMLSVMVVGAGAAFTDQDKIVNTEAVDVCVALNIINGFEDGSYRPEGNITRAEACKMICIALNGGKVPVLGTNDVPTFTDIDGHWAEAYIEYCVSEGIVAGVGDGKFDPKGNVTGSQFAKMLLIALGYNANHEKFTGSAWDVNVNVKASDKNLYEGIETIEVNAPLTRDNAAQMLWNALQAYIVEYTSTLITNSKGELVAQYVVGDKVVGVDSNGDPHYRTLLGEEYVGDVGYTYLKSYSYDDAKGIWTYNFDADILYFGGNDINPNDKVTATLKSDVDYTDFFGQKIKIVYKTEVNDVIYGIYSYDSEIVAEAATGQVDTKIDVTNNTATVNDESIRFDSVTSVPVYDWNSTAVAYSGGMSAVANDHSAFTFQLVDNNTDGKVDVVLRIPMSVAKILYTGTETVTFGTPIAATQNDKDITIYDDYAKDDWVAQVAGTNAVTCMATYEKMDVQTGTIEGIKTVNGEENYLIDGTWYTNGTPATNLVKLNNNDTIEFVAVGNRFFHTKIAESGLTGKDIVMVVTVGTTAVDTTVGGGDIKAKLLFSDNTTETVGLSKVDGAAATYTADSSASGNSVDAVGHLYTYRIDKDGDYELTKISATNLAGYDKIGTSTTKAYESEKIGGYELADNAIVFALTNGSQGTAAASNKGEVFSGREIKNNYTKTSFGTKQTSGYADALVGTVDGFEYARVAALVSPVNINTGSNYGYIIASWKSMEGSENYRYFTIWTEDGELTVKENSTNDLVKEGLVPGMIMTYDIKDDSGDVMIVKNVSVPQTTTAAITGWTESNGKIQFNESFSNKITSDTVVIYVNSEKMKGAEGGSIVLCNDANGDLPGGKVDNVRYICGADAAYVDLLVVDVENKMQPIPVPLYATATTPAGALSLLTTTDVTNVTVPGSVSVSGDMDVPAGKTVTFSGTATADDHNYVARDEVVNGTTFTASAPAATLTAGSTVTTFGGTLSSVATGISLAGTHDSYAFYNLNLSAYGATGGSTVSFSDRTNTATIAAGTDGLCLMVGNHTGSVTLTIDKDGDPSTTNDVATVKIDFPKW